MRRRVGSGETAMATVSDVQAKAISAMGYDGGLTLAMRTTSLDRAIGWYRDVLGFTLLYRVDQIAWCELQSPVARVNVGFSEVEAVAPGGGAVPTWGVEDIAAAKAALEGHGVTFDGDIVEYPGMVKLLTFYDPDGNALMLYQDLSSGG
jgi:catechol 2,3-dioxygenase-like lactoylglutathione lyase family enzyme